jgi:hypothetical protein
MPLWYEHIAQVTSIIFAQSSSPFHRLSPHSSIFVRQISTKKAENHTVILEIALFAKSQQCE